MGENPNRPPGKELSSHRLRPTLAVAVVAGAVGFILGTAVFEPSFLTVGASERLEAILFGGVIFGGLAFSAVAIPIVRRILQRKWGPSDPT